MTFSESSIMLKIVKVNVSLLSNLWDSWLKTNWFLKLLILPFAISYSIIALVFAAIFCIATILEILPYVVRLFTDYLIDVASESHSPSMEFFKIVFLPILVFICCIVLLVIVLLPKTIEVAKDATV